MGSDIGSEMNSFRRWLTNERESKHTVKAYTYLFGIFLNFIGKPAREANPDDIDAFKSYLVSVRLYSKNSQHLAINAIRAFFRCQMLPIPYNLTLPRRRLSIPTYLTESETALLLKQSKKNVKEHAIVSVFVYTGIRVAELCGIDVEDCSIEERTIRVRHGKGDRDRIVFMSTFCARSVKKYLNIRNSLQLASSALFVSGRRCRYNPSTIQRMIKRLANIAGIKKRVTPHVLRHTFATSVLRRGSNLRFIQEILGHNSLATTQIYMHLDEATMSKTYERYQPIYRLSKSKSPQNFEK